MVFNVFLIPRFKVTWPGHLTPSGLTFFLSPYNPGFAWAYNILPLRGVIPLFSINPDVD
jgi:hypothetical protein